MPRMSEDERRRRSRAGGIPETPGDAVMALQHHFIDQPGYSAARFETAAFRKNP